MFFQEMVGIQMSSTLFFSNMRRLLKVNSVFTMESRLFQTLITTDVFATVSTWSKNQWENRSMSLTSLVLNGDDAIDALLDSAENTK